MKNMFTFDLQKLFILIESRKTDRAHFTFKLFCEFYVSNILLEVHSDTSLSGLINAVKGGDDNTENKAVKE